MPENAEKLRIVAEKHSGILTAQLPGLKVAQAHSEVRLLGAKGLAGEAVVNGWLRVG